MQRYERWWMQRNLSLGFETISKSKQIYGDIYVALTTCLKRRFSVNLRWIMSGSSNAVWRFLEIIVDGSPLYPIKASKCKIWISWDEKASLYGYRNVAYASGTNGDEGFFKSSCVGSTRQKWGVVFGLNRAGEHR